MGRVPPAYLGHLRLKDILLRTRFEGTAKAEAAGKEKEGEGGGSFACVHAQA